MGHHEKTLKLTDHVIEGVFSHMYENSWGNILDMGNWVMGVTNTPEDALDFHNRNSDPAPKYYKTFDCASVENAGEVKAYFNIIGVPENESGFEGNPVQNRLIYVYKCGL